MTAISQIRAPRVARQFSARSHGFVTLTVAITLIAMTASFALSFNAQVAIASLIGLQGWMRFLLPVGVDSFILVSALALALLRERNGVPALLPSGKRPPWWRTAQGRQWSLLWAWVGASIGLNVWHGLDSVPAGSSTVVIVGVAVVSVLFPAGVLTATESLLKLLIQEPTDSAELAAAKTRLINHGAPVAAQPGAKPKSVAAQDLDLRIRAEFALADVPPTLKALAEKFGVSEARVKLARDAA
jgi:hypothetical protein